MFPCIPDSVDLAFNAAVAETAGNQDTGYAAQELSRVFGSNGLRIHPFDMDLGVVGYCTVL